MAPSGKKDRKDGGREGGSRHQDRGERAPKQLAPRNQRAQSRGQREGGGRAGTTGEQEPMHQSVSHREGVGREQAPCVIRNQRTNLSCTQGEGRG
eukprot:1139810-Pelagomonas_calceolata.AAC.7